ncbi:hypothetical protein C8R45DRAFT_319779 [Mycena sanguinolenta]|nr:hypothetical protein C8R45DRAFT_319779 [Mycena sanguinolenta]
MSRGFACFDLLARLPSSLFSPWPSFVSSDPFSLSSTLVSVHARPASRRCRGLGPAATGAVYSMVIIRAYFVSCHAAGEGASPHDVRIAGRGESSSAFLPFISFFFAVFLSSSESGLLRIRVDLSRDPLSWRFESPTRLDRGTARPYHTHGVDMRMLGLDATRGGCVRSGPSEFHLVLARIALVGADW